MPREAQQWCPAESLGWKTLQEKLFACCWRGPGDNNDVRVGWPGRIRWGMNQQVTAVGHHVLNAGFAWRFIFSFFVALVNFCLNLLFALALSPLFLHVQPGWQGGRASFGIETGRFQIQRSLPIHQARETVCAFANSCVARLLQEINGGVTGDLRGSRAFRQLDSLLPRQGEVIGRFWHVRLREAHEACCEKNTDRKHSLHATSSTTRT